MGMFLWNSNKISRFIIQTFSIQDTTEQRSILLKFRFFFFTYKCGRGRSISKVSQMLKNVNQDLQGCPTIPHDHPMCLHHPVGAYLCVLSTTIFPYKSRKSKKKSTSVTPTPEKTSDSAFSSKVRSTKVKLEIRNSKNWLSYTASTWRGFMPGPAIYREMGLFNEG